MNIESAIIILLVAVVPSAGLALQAKERWPLFKTRGLAIALRSEKLTGPGVAYLAKTIGGNVWKLGDGYVLQVGNQEHKFATLSEASLFVRGMLPAVTVNEKENDSPVSRDESVTADEAHTSKDREHKRLIQRLAVWYAMCLVIVAVWLFLLGGPHSYRFTGEISYRRVLWDRRFFWDCFKYAGIAWFATTLIYALLARNLEPREGATKPPSA